MGINGNRVPYMHFNLPFVLQELVVEYLQYLLPMLNGLKHLL